MTRKKLIDPNATKAIQEFNEETGAEIVNIDKSQEDGFIYVHSGDATSRAIIEEAERQFTNRKK